MSTLIVSTVGTSLLTNQIDDEFDSESSASQLLATVNASEEDIQKYYPDVMSILTNLEERAEQGLDEDDPFRIRDLSAELNGIYSFYTNDLSQARDDAHILVATDTAQGKITARLLADHLRSKGIGNVCIMTADKLSIANERIFSEGIADLLLKSHLQKTIEDYRKDKYDICFNLVGGFKALQGFFNVIGMFYADEIIYVFEGSNELIKIPKLPITIDPNKLEPYKVPMAMMNAGDIRASWEHAKKVPSDWVINDDKDITLSTWGTLLWSQCKESLLSEKLLDFPNFIYEKSFKDDYCRKVVTRERKIELHEVLAKVSTQFMKFNGDTSRLASSLRYSRYEGGNINHIDHFYVNNNDGWRVSCIAKSEKLYLRHYGEHDYVNDNP